LDPGWIIHQENGCKNLKQLIVGARYIRDHEIKYIDEIFQVMVMPSCRIFVSLGVQYAVVQKHLETMAFNHEKSASHRPSQLLGYQ
jgi:hypothetical protein